jgi:hypothetical protein
LGTDAGTACTSSESNNIYLSHNGVASESGAIRLGTSGNQTTCFVQGISGVTSAGAVATVINSSGQLGTVISSKKYKQDIMDVDKNPIMDLTCVQYKELNGNPKELHYGFIAEDVMNILPEVIVWEKEKDKDGKLVYDSLGNLLFSDKDPETIQYQKLWPLLQDYVKKMDNRLKRLEREFEDVNERPTKKARVV